MKCKRKKAEIGLGTAALIGAIVSAIGAGTSAGINIHNAKVNASAEKLRQRYENMSEADKNSQLFSGNFQSFYNNQEAIDERKNSLTLPTLNNSQFKCGGKRYYDRFHKSKFGCKK